jgi:competence protein ComEA
VVPPVGSKININTADIPLLITLPGIGEAKAGAIVNYRVENGPFKKISDINKVSGIGPATYQKLEELICVD